MKKIQYKKIREICIFLASVCIFLIVTGFYYVQSKKTIVLEFGMFTGSNWDVANDATYTLIDKILRKFERMHPGVKVHYYSGIRKDDYSEWFSERVLEGKMPDVAMILGPQFNKFASMGILKDLTPELEEQMELKSDDYFPAAWNAGSYHNRQYGIPYEVDFMLMAVNATFLQACGCEVPDSSWTWDDFYDLCKKTTTVSSDDSLGKKTSGVCNYRWESAAYSNGAHLFDDYGTKSYFDDERVMDAVRFIQRLDALTQGRPLSSADFDAGRVAFMPLSFAHYRTYTSYPYKINKDMDNDWRCLTMPAGPSGDNISEMNTLLMGISATTKQERLAFELLKMFTHNEETQRDVFRYASGASPLRSITLSYDSSQLFNIMEKSVTLPKFRRYEENMVLADNFVNDVITGKKAADSNLKLFQQTMQSILER